MRVPGQKDDIVVGVQDSLEVTVPAEIGRHARPLPLRVVG